MWTSTSRETIIPRKYNISIQFLYLTLYTYRKRNYDIKSAYPGNQEQIILEAPVPGRQVHICWCWLMATTKLKYVTVPGTTLFSTATRTTTWSALRLNTDNLQGNIQNLFTTFNAFYLFPWLLFLSLYIFLCRLLPFSVSPLDLTKFLLFSL